eukprot:CAMPEP_0115446936 /NCGR_PEP_ID=MMETSP0271-20121206/39705_1 /TAXON_ID=71861 /ORGANISM="Scrippsiella trochoidea, Strain CCMP3099" /LENGTH=83 /DNA_ID=CAMNT_0002872987 /DNA_START=202 /DNA_END=450 /DNA_ORIENTATION=+
MSIMRLWMLGARGKRLGLQARTAPVRAPPTQVFHAVCKPARPVVLASTVSEVGAQLRLVEDGWIPQLLLTMGEVALAAIFAPT